MRDKAHVLEDHNTEPWQGGGWEHHKSTEKQPIVHVVEVPWMCSETIW